MPRRREKTRTDHLVDALELHLRAGGSLEHIDLRSVSGDLKDTIKLIRRLHGELSKALALAIRQDAPSTVARRRRT